MTEEQKEKLYIYLRERLSNQVYSDYQIHTMVEIMPMLISYDLKDMLVELQVMAECYMKIIDEEKK